MHLLWVSGKKIKIQMNVQKKTKEFKVIKALSENENNQSDATFLCFTATQFLLKIRQISTPFPVFTNVTF